MNVKIDAPSYECRDFGEVPYLDASAVFAEDGSSLSIFCVNRSREVMELDLRAAGFETIAPVEHVELRHDDPKATNTAAAPCRVEPRRLQVAEMSRLAPLSYNLLRYTVGGARRLSHSATAPTANSCPMVSDGETRGGCQNIHHNKP